MAIKFKDIVRQAENARRRWNQSVREAPGQLLRGMKDAVSLTVKHVGKMQDAQAENQAKYLEGGMQQGARKRLDSFFYDKAIGADRIKAIDERIASGDKDFIREQARKQVRILQDVSGMLMGTNDAPVDVVRNTSRVTQVAKKLLQKNRTGLVEEYISRFGNKVDADSARELFRKVGYDGKNASAVHEVSSQIADDAFFKLVKERPQKKVLFLAGGGGSGKTAATRAFANDDYAAVFDGTFSNFESAARRINVARQAGKEVEVVFVGRNAADAWKEGVLRRLSKGDDRVVPLDVFVQAHTNAPKTVQRIIDEMPDVDVKFISNTGKLDDIAEQPVANISKLRYEEKKLAKELYDYTEQQITKGTITQEQGDALLGAYRRGLPEDFQRGAQQLDGQKINQVPSGFDQQGVRRVGNVRLDKFELPEGGADDIARIINENSGFVGQRRGVQTFEMTKKIAQEIQPKINLKPGKSLNAEELQALGNAVASLQLRVTKLANQVTSGTNADLDILKLQSARAELAAALASYSGATAEAGRSLQILRATRRALDSNDPDLIQKAIKISGGRENAEDIAKRLLELGDDEVAKFRFLRNLQKPTRGDYLTWHFYSSILSGPATHIRNTYANAANLLVDLISKPFAAGIDYAKTVGYEAVGVQREREVLLGEIPHEIVGTWVGLKSGTRKALFMLKNGFSLDDVAHSELAKPEAFRGVFPNLVSRSLQASDEFFRSMFASKELYSIAYTRAYKEGLSGRELATRAAEIVTDPSVDIIEQVAKAGAKGVYQKELGELGKGLSRLRDDVILEIRGKPRRIFNPIKFVIPFVQTPVNVVKEGLELTPLGLFTGAVNNTPRMASKVQGRALLGSIVLTSLAFPAAEGKISGNGPSDPDLRDLLYEQGWQPNSIKIGSTWYNYQSTPFAVPLSLLGNSAEMWMYDGEKPSVGALLAKMGDTLLNQGYLSGISALQDALDEPERFGPKFVNNFLRSMVPASGALGQIARAVDPVIRNPDGTIEYLKSGIPGQSQFLSPLRNALGTEATRPGGFLNQFNPMKSSPERDNFVVEELREVGYVPNEPTKKVGNRQMHKAQFSEFLRVSGSLKTQIMLEAFGTDGYQDLGIDEKVKVIQKIVEKANDYGRQYIRGELELDAFGIQHDKLNVEQREILNSIIITDGYKKLSDSEKRELIQKTWDQIKE